MIIGLIAGAVAMYLKSHKDIDAVTTALEATQDKLKSVKSQLYKRRTSYKKKSPNTQANGKKTARKKTTTNSKNSNIQ